MSSYNPNIPQPSDFLSDSQQDILDNFIQSNVSFGVNHYNFSDGSANNGKHNKVTTPLIVGSAHPATAANEPIFYAMQDTANLGVLQYSRGGNNAQPTPLTTLQSSSSPIILPNSTSVNILDFSGISSAVFNVYLSNIDSSNPDVVFYTCWFRNAPEFNLGFVFRSSGSAALRITSSGSILRLTNASSSINFNKVYWTLQFLRITI